MIDRNSFAIRLLVVMVLLFAGNNYALAANGAPAQEIAPHNRMETMRENALKGDPRAQNYLGMLALFGFGGAPDYAAAMNWFTRAADQGYPEATVQIGILYENGLGVEADPVMAVKYYRQAADLNWATGLFRLGMIYFRGIPEGKTQKDGLEVLEKSCNIGYQQACAMKLYYENKNTEALSIFESLCQTGDHISCNMVEQIRTHIASNPQQADDTSWISDGSGLTMVYYALVLIMLIGAGIALFMVWKKSGQASQSPEEAVKDSDKS